MPPPPLCPVEAGGGPVPDSSASFHQGIGSERKAARLRYLRDRRMSRLRGRPGVVLRTSPDPSQSCALANVAIERIDPKHLAAHLWDSGRILVVAIDHEEVPGLRVTPHVHTTLDEGDRFSRAMERAIEKGLPA